MRIVEYRDGPFVNREKEATFLLERFKSKRPESILFIYGPKSSGKTTLLEYIVEEKLQKERKKFYVNYVNFRRYAIHSYESFLNIYFKPITEENKSYLARMISKFNIVLSGLKGEVSIPEQGINYMISFNLYQGMEEKKIDPFDLFFEVLKKIKSRGKQPVIIIDEVQELRDIYMNGELQKKYLLTEFFKFLVSLTKETHLAHVVVSTSSSLFIDEIYNNSKLAETSDFYLVGYFDYETTKEWLEIEGFKEEEIDLIWEYFGGSPFRLKMVIDDKKMGNIEDLEKYLKRHASIIADKIGLTISNDLKGQEERDCFRNILKILLKEGYKERDEDNEIEKRVIEIGIDKDIFFIREGKVTFNSQIMKKGAEVYVKERFRG